MKSCVYDSKTKGVFSSNSTVRKTLNMQILLPYTIKGRKVENVLSNDAHSAHFIYGYVALDQHMVKNHSDKERGNPLPPLHGPFLISTGWNDK